MPRKPRLDDVDVAIIAQLQQDGRRPYTRIAEEVGLSEAGVRQRVARLVASGVMDIVAVTDPLELGFGMLATVGVRVRGADILATAELIAALPEVSYLVVVTGSIDLLVEVICRDQEHLLELLTRRLGEIPGVEQTESFVHLRTLKESHRWVAMTGRAPAGKR